MLNHDNIFDDVQRQIDESILVEIQQELGITFPPEIKKHYLTYNGGCPKRYVLRRDANTYVVQEFLPIKYGRDEQLLLEDAYRDLVRDRHVIPQYLIPFAIDPGGDFFCFSTRHEDLGAIFFFQGEYALDKPERSVDYLASSFADFVEHLEPDD